MSCIRINNAIVCESNVVRKFKHLFRIYYVEENGCGRAISNEDGDIMEYDTYDNVSTNQEGRVYYADEDRTVGAAGANSWKYR